MSSFPHFSSFPPEIRHKIWHNALQEETESRLVIVHPPTKKVLPHKSTQSLVMNANRESRDYAQSHFYDVKLDVWTLNIDCSITKEIAELGKMHSDLFCTDRERPEPFWNPELIKPPSLHGDSDNDDAKIRRYVQRHRDWAENDLQPKESWHLSSYFYNDVFSLLRALPPKKGEETKCQGIMYVSSQNDRFALVHPALSKGPIWFYSRFHIFERAFLACQVRGPPIADIPIDAPMTRHMAGRLPNDVLQRIRRLGRLYQRPTLDSRSNIRSRSDGWRLDLFKDATEFFTAYMTTIPSCINLGSLGLIEWDKINEEEGVIVFIRKPKETGGVADGARG